jgi:hypothetical protein
VHEHVRVLVEWPQTRSGRQRRLESRLMHPGGGGHDAHRRAEIGKQCGSVQRIIAVVAGAGQNQRLGTGHVPTERHEQSRRLSGQARQWPWP